MRKYLKLSVFLFLAALIVSISCIGCGGSDDGVKGPSATPDPTKATYKIGAVLSLTGVYENLGIPEKKTIDMLEKQINDAGGINGHAVDFIIYDDQSDATKTYSLTKRLADEQNVLAIVGASTSGGSVAILNTTLESSIPVISLAGSSKIVTPVADRYWMFKMPPSEYQVLDMLLPYLQSQNITRIAMITATSGWGQSGKAAIPVEAPKFNLSIVIREEYDNTAPSVQAQLQSIKGTDAQAIVCWDTEVGSAMVARDMKTLNMTMPLFCSHGMANKGFLDLAGNAADGTVLAVGKVLIAEELNASDPQKATLVKYKNDFEALYGAGMVNPFGGHAYDAVNILVPVLTSMNESLNLSEARAYIRDGIEKTAGYTGTGGVYTMSAADHLGLSEELSNFLVIIKVVDGKWTWVKQ